MNSMIPLLGSLPYVAKVRNIVFLSGTSLKELPINRKRIMGIPYNRNYKVPYLI
jgi:hypothetical protein